MSLFTKLGNDIASPVDASGALRSVENGDMQRWMTEVERLFVALAAEQGGSLTLPNLMIRYTITGGTPDAIVATPNLPLPDAPGEALFTIQIVAANTGSVTLNGKPLRTNSGNEIAPGGLTAGSIHAFLDLGDHFRLLSDQASAAIVAQAEADANRAQNYAAMLSADKIKFPTVAALLADEIMSYDDGEGLIEVGSGDIIEAQGFRYEVAAISAMDAHVETAGGVKLYLASLDEVLREQSRAINHSVGYDEQSLTPEQQLQARTNIGAGVSSSLVDLSPIYLDQITTGFHGRGMLDAETNNIATEQMIAASSAAGDSQITVASATNFLAGTNITIKHDNGRYWTYWIYDKSGETLTISPALKWNVSAAGGAAERTWFNRSHAGKFYIRQLAQRLVYEDELGMQIATRGRSFLTQFVQNESIPEDQLSDFDGGEVNYYDASSTNTGDTHWPVRFGQRASAYIAMSSPGAGAATAPISVQPGSVNVVRVITKTNSIGLQALLVIRALTDPVWTLAAIKLPSGPDGGVQQVTTVAFRAPIGVSSVVLRFENAGGSGALAVGQIEVFPAEPRKGNVLKERPNARIVVCGDSWAAGDEGDTPEREALATALAAELPSATVINKGVGGSTIWGLLPNFQTIVAAEEPDFVVLHTGVNECYSPASATFNPNHLNLFTQYMNQFVCNCLGIGAKPIIIGTPALAEADVGSGYSDWDLNDRACLQSAWFYANL